jgi:hypothetical protein
MFGFDHGANARRSIPIWVGSVLNGLMENRKRKRPARDGLYSYYRATSLGEGVLERGVRELMREEWDLL